MINCWQSLELTKLPDLPLNELPDEAVNISRSKSFISRMIILQTKHFFLRYYILFQFKEYCVKWLAAKSLF